MLRETMTFLPRAVAFVAVLAAGWLLARLARTVVAALLVRTGFTRAVERGGAGAALARSGHDAGDLVARLAGYGVLLCAAQIAFGLWGPNPVSGLLTTVILWLPRAFVAIVVVVVAAAVARVVKDIVGGALGGLAYGRMLAGTAHVVIVGLGVIAALDQIGVARTVTTPVLIAVLATVGGVIVVGVGGGLIRPMQDRWASWLDRVQREAPLIAAQARAYEQVRRDAVPAQTAPEETQVISAEATQRL